MTSREHEGISDSGGTLQQSIIIEATPDPTTSLVSINNSEFLSSDEVHPKLTTMDEDPSTNETQSSSGLVSSLIQQFIQSNPSVNLAFLCQVIASFWEETPDEQNSYLRIPQELKKFDLPYISGLPPLDLVRCMAAIHLEILTGPVPLDLKISLRGAYWFLQQIHEAVKTRWSTTLSASLSDNDPNWFAYTVGPLMQKALHFNTDEVHYLISQLSEALAISYSEFLTHRISVVANDDSIFEANWAFNCSSASKIRPPLQKLPIEIIHDTFEVTRRLLRALDPLLKSLEILGATVGLLIAADLQDELVKASLIYDILPIDLNSIVCVAIHLAVAIAQNCHGLEDENKWTNFAKPFRSIRHRIDGIQGRFLKMYLESPLKVVEQMHSRVLELIKPTDRLLSFFSKEILEENPYTILTQEFPIPSPASQAFESYRQRYVLENDNSQPSSSSISRTQETSITRVGQSGESSIMLAALDSELASFEHASIRRKAAKPSPSGTPDVGRRRRKTSLTVYRSDSSRSPNRRRSKDIPEETHGHVDKSTVNDNNHMIRNELEKDHSTLIDEMPRSLPNFDKAELCLLQQQVQHHMQQPQSSNLRPQQQIGFVATKCQSLQVDRPSPSYPVLEDHPNNSNSFDASNLASWEVDHSEVQLEHRVGSGATATVFRGTWRGTEVAVKKMSGQLADSESLSKFQREIQILLKLRHPNLALLMGASVRRRPYFVVMEYCVGGDLFTLLHLPEKSCHQITQLTILQKLKIATDIGKGMTYLHKMSPQIIHRDLKSLNILLANVVRSKTDEPLAKITDFGLSQLRSGCPSELLHQTAAVGTYHWMAPEVLMSQPYNEKVDVYSFGILLYEIFSQSIPYSSPPISSSSKQQYTPINNPVNIALAVAQGHRPSFALIPRDCPSSVVTLMSACWSHDPNQRPNFETILQTLKRVSQSLTNASAQP